MMATLYVSETGIRGIDGISQRQAARILGISSNLADQA